MCPSQKKKKPLQHWRPASAEGERGGRAPLSITSEQTQAPTGRGRNVGRHSLPPPLGFVCHENPRLTVFNEQDWRTSLYANAAHILIRRPEDAELYSVFADDIGPDRIKLTAKSMGFAEIEDRIRQEREDWSHYTGRAG